MTVRVKEADGALNLLFHMLALHTDLVTCHAEFPAGQLAEGRLNKALVEGVVINHRRVVRAIRDWAVSAGRVPVHDGTVAKVPGFDSRIALRNGLVKFYKMKIPVYDIDIVLKINIHSPVSKFTAS